MPYNQAPNITQPSVETSSGFVLKIIATLGLVAGITGLISWSILL